MTVVEDEKEEAPAKKFFHKVADVFTAEAPEATKWVKALTQLE
jgi:hypothetical protein